MAAKRFFDESGSNPDQPNEKRMRTRPSFASYVFTINSSYMSNEKKNSLEYYILTIFSLDSVIGEVVMGNFFQNFCSVLEPMLRKVVCIYEQFAFILLFYYFHITLYKSYYILTYNYENNSGD